VRWDVEIEETGYGLVRHRSGNDVAADDDAVDALAPHVGQYGFECGRLLWMS
jgi:hypothetical protein